MEPLLHLLRATNMCYDGLPDKARDVFALDFYRTIVDSGCATVSYHAIKISSS